VEITRLCKSAVTHDLIDLKGFLLVGLAAQSPQGKEIATIFEKFKLNGIYVLNVILCSDTVRLSPALEGIMTRPASELCNLSMSIPCSIRHTNYV